MNEGKALGHQSSMSWGIMEMLEEEYAVLFVHSLSFGRSLWSAVEMEFDPALCKVDIQESINPFNPSVR